MKKTKKSLVLSIVTLLLCSCMFIGSTFAWFTDTVSNTGNKIQAGTLDIGLEKWNGTEFEDISDSSDPIFDYDKWEPGYSEIVGLKVVNNGTLALKYMINIVVNGDASKLAEAIEVYTKIVDDPTQFVLPTSFDVVKATESGFKKTALTEVLSYGEGAAHVALLASQDNASPIGEKLEAKESATMIVVLHMKEEAGNEYQDLSLGTTFDINVFATQYTYEKDGFGSDQYDIDTPWMGEVADGIPVDPENENVYLISNGSELAKLSQMATTTEGRNAIGGKTFKLVKDIDLNNVPFVSISQPNNSLPAWTFDGNSKTILNLKINGEKGVGLFTYCPGLTVKNLTVDHADVSGINMVGVIAGNGTCIKIDKCMVKDAKVTTLVANNDDGDKAGAIVGYLCADGGDAKVSNCVVDNVTVKGYRDIGGIVGYAGGTYTVTGNTIENSTIINDKSNNYNNYSTDSEYDVNEIVGEKTGSGTYSDNRYEKCKIYRIESTQDYVNQMISGAESGDTVVLPASNEPIDLPAINVENLTIAGNGENTVVKTNPTGSTKLNQENLVLKDLTLELGNNTGTDGAVNVTKKTSFENVTFTYDESAPKYAIMVSRNEDVEFINCKFNMEGKTRGIMVWGGSPKITVDGCTFDCVYPFNVDSGSPEFIVKNSTLNGWTSYTTTAKASFTDCKFGKSTSGYEYCRPYSNATFTNCEFSSGFLADFGAEGVALTFNNCKQNGSPVTKNIIEPKFQASGKAIIDGTEYTFTNN